MVDKKKGAILLGLAMLGVLALWLAGHGRIPGSGLVERIPMENIARVTARKTLENSSGAEELGARDLTPEEVRRFYGALSETRLREMGERPFSITTEERYYISFLDAQGRVAGTMKFYGDRALIFDYAWGDRPAVHQRYSIDPSGPSSLNDFFALPGLWAE